MCNFSTTSSCIQTTGLAWYPGHPAVITRRLSCPSRCVDVEDSSGSSTCQMVSVQPLHHIPGTVFCYGPAQAQLPAICALAFLAFSHWALVGLGAIPNLRWESVGSFLDCVEELRGGFVGTHGLGVSYLPSLHWVSVSVARCFLCVPVGVFCVILLSVLCLSAGVSKSISCVSMFVSSVSMSISGGSVSVPLVSYVYFHGSSRLSPEISVPVPCGFVCLLDFVCPGFCMWDPWLLSGSLTYHFLCLQGLGCSIKLKYHQRRASDGGCEHCILKELVSCLAVWEAHRVGLFAPCRLPVY
ncbi:hypothetical protein K402DRAFT_171000 [Aulographum hederae CBS 113979]|uniref:Uncharacterized protein n=1 Tax=Aulographum hederae CBS 113979 TaxID=1176131 RepID=A0A6G1HDJ2_9PEZI|nr:hypothetical protein K402DRAFT_171000 [Aulographum hederae CBS 113979]